MFPCLCAQGSSIAEYLDYSRGAVKRDTCVLVCLYALRGFTRPSYISGGGGGGKRGGEEGGEELEPSMPILGYGYHHPPPPTPRHLSY